MLRPYKVRAFDLRPHNSQDAMHVIRHDNKRLEFDLRKMKRNFEPGLLNDASQGSQLDSTVYDLARRQRFRKAQIVTKYKPRWE